MADNERAPAGNGGSDENNHVACHHSTVPYEPPPPGFIDLGDGTLFGGGTAAQCRAGAEWLRRHYPEHSAEPPTWTTEPVIYDMLIHHSQIAKGFAKLPNETLRDERLSIAARGHLAYLLSMPNGWDTTADREAKRARQLRGNRGEGRDAFRGIYGELKSAGYIYYERKRQAGGTMATEIHVADRPRSEAEWKAFTDVRLTDVPETRMSVPPAEMPEDWPEPGETFPQVAPMYGSPGVGSPDVGSPVHRRAVRSTEDVATEELKDELVRVDDGVGDWGARGNHPRHQEDDDHSQGQEQPSANSQNRRVHTGPDTVADEAQEIPFNDSESATAGSCARAREASGGAAAPLSEPAQTAASDATTPAPDAAEHQRNEIARLEAWMRDQQPESDPDSQFAEFWTAYPRKVGRAKARAVWDAQVAAGADPGAIALGAARYATQERRAGTEERYMPYPVNWLDDQRWIGQADPDRRRAFWEV